MDPKKYSFNLQKSPHDPRDIMLEAVYPDAVTLPAIWDMTPNMRPVRDQGQYGTCAAQTAAAMKEWEEFQDVQFKDYMSPQFIYNLRDGGGEGMNPRNVMEILFKIGIVPENDYPYTTTKPITDELKAAAAKYKIEGYAQINTLDSLKKALFANGPCFFAFPVYDPESMEFWKPTSVGQQALGGHAVCCAGYLQDKFIIRNSWGVSWGEGGYTYFPFSEWGMQWEVWTGIDASSNPETLAKKAKKFKR
jgi:C1A family cysteine protease